MKRELTTSEVLALIEWAEKNHSKNWGGWKDYPVKGCTYLQFENNPLRVKFDTFVTYQGKRFNAVNWSRLAQGINFYELRDLVPLEERPAFVPAPTYEFEHPNGNKFVLKQNSYREYQSHDFFCTLADGRVRNFTTKSGLYTQMLECLPKGAEII